MLSFTTITVDKKKDGEYKYQEYLQQYEKLLENEQKMSSNILSSIDYLALATFSLQACSLQIAMGYLTESYLGKKWDDCLLAARKDLVRCMLYLEKVYTNSLDVPFSEYEKEVIEVFEVDEFKRYNFLKIVGFYITFLGSIFFEKGKWHRFFVELEERLTIFLKNSINFKSLRGLMDPRAPFYRERVEVVNMLRELLRKSAQTCRTRYELISLQMADFSRAIEFLSSVKRLEMVLANIKEVEELDREISVWKTKLRTDECQRNKK